MKQILVIGAGASGMLAAISAARCAASVTLLEGKEKPGRKLLVTGSGRCNLTNHSLDVETCYRGADPAFINSILKQFPVEKTLSFFEEAGLRTCSRGGYVYPVTGQAQSVLNVLLLELRRLGVKIKYSEKVISLKKAGEIWEVSTHSWTYRADSVILAAGSCAAPATGSDGSGYKLAEQAGHSLVKPYPALVPMKAEGKFLKKLSGVRMPADISLTVCKKMFRESGELQWTDYGISGIAAFQLSGLAAREMAAGQSGRGKKVAAVLDLLPFETQEKLFMWACSHGEGRRYEDLFAGLLPVKAIQPLLEAAGGRPSAVFSMKNSGEFEKLIHTLKHFTLNITGVKGFENAQVCSGGVDTSEVNACTLESKLAPGLYITGELLDVDGICGGYNLQWAWSSGWAAGRAASGGKTV